MMCYFLHKIKLRKEWIVSAPLYNNLISDYAVENALGMKSGPILLGNYYKRK